jgi:hypothetical protein
MLKFLPARAKLSWPESWQATEIPFEQTKNDFLQEQRSFSRSISFILMKPSLVVVTNFIILLFILSFTLA